MKFIKAAVYNDYISANLAQGLLESENINCWLKDENVVTVQPFLTNALDGIKLMVAEPQLQRALDILASTKQEFKEKNPCPNCGSTNVEYIYPPAKTRNWLGTIFSALIILPVNAIDRVYHCYDCGHESEDADDN